MKNTDSYKMAIYDFQRARQKAALEEVVARVSRRSNDLLSFEDVTQKLKLTGRSEGGVRTIPVKSIVGSVGRCTEFTRTFLPRNPDDQERWARVKAVFTDPSGSGLPPIEVYQVGDVYFVQDGNHRVSIARQEGNEFIDAHVIRVLTPIPLAVDVQPDDLIIKAEYAEFLEDTALLSNRPNVDLSVSVPGQYLKLRNQIDVRISTAELANSTQVSLKEAAVKWFDELYIPTAEAIRDRGLMEWFPNRTITDMYVWISDHHEALKTQLGWEISMDAAAADLAIEESSRAEAADKVSGHWRESKTVERYTDRLFKNILVPLDEDIDFWQSLDQAILVAQKEKAVLHGLHVVTSKKQLKSTEVTSLKAHFKEKCRDAGVEGNLAVEYGDITRKICERAILTDLIILKMAHPPQGGFSSIVSAYRSIITHSSRPLLGVPFGATRLDNVLLAYDGGAKAREALFVAAYLAEAWNVNLTVFTSPARGTLPSKIQDFAREYLEIHEVTAEFVLAGNTFEEITDILVERKHNLVLLGGYGGSLIFDLFAGSTLDFVLRESLVPTFICR